MRDNAQDLPISTETDLLIALSRLHLSAETVEACREFILGQSETIDWGSFIDQAARHKVLALVSRHILRHRLFDDAKNGHWAIPYWWLYENVYYSGRRRNRALSDEFGKVIRWLDDGGLPYAIRKGPVISERLYRDPGIRRMGDMDILIAREDTTRLAAALEDLGYVQGRVSANGNTVQQFNRSTQVYWRMHVKTNSLPFVKIANVEQVESFNIDVCFNISQPRSDSVTNTVDLLERRVRTEICGEMSWALSLDDQFIDLCAHLHKEATSAYYIKGGFDLELLKFLDIALVCAESSEKDLWAAIGKQTEKYNAGQSVYYALYHTALLYPDAVPTEILDRFRPSDVGFLEEYGTFEGRPQKWDTPFLNRLFDAKRVRHIAGVNIPPRA
ncbi:nucleotidyltransferase family protein [Streptomyces olindensis]|uniref:nucleotidyltransferase domain-containing protein n=1 Tax=Streptomyces olindensis TaxID=358823 RepID=UPI00367F92A7